MNRTIRLCTLAGSDGIAIPAPFVDVRRRGLFSDVLSEKGRVPEVNSKRFLSAEPSVEIATLSRYHARGFKSAFEWNPVDRVDR
jgi:hypothetical protein